MHEPGVMPHLVSAFCAKISLETSQTFYNDIYFRLRRVPWWRDDFAFFVFRSWQDTRHFVRPVSLPRAHAREKKVRAKGETPKIFAFKHDRAPITGLNNTSIQCSDHLTTTVFPPVHYVCAYPDHM